MKNTESPDDAEVWNAAPVSDDGRSETPGGVGSSGDLKGSSTDPGVGTRAVDATEAEPSTDALVRRAQRGDDAAFAALLARLRPRVYRWALAAAANADDAEDVTQDVVLKLHRKLKTFRGRSRFSSWLYRVTRNAAAEQHRKRARRGELLEEAAREAAMEIPRGSSLDHRLRALDDARLAELVRGFFEELPARQRQVFDLADLQGYTSPEIAEMLEIEPVTVRTTLFRARSTIRSRILETRPELVEDRSGATE